MSDPTLLTKRNGQGRPSFTEEQYSQWLSEMKPHLELGCSIYRATIKAIIDDHYDVILDKYKLGDWFSRKIDAYRAMPGENVNEALSRLAMKANEKIKRDEIITKEDFDVLKLMAEKHRTAQPFFVNRTEQAPADDKNLGKIIEALDNTDYDDVAREAEKQMVAANASVQNQEQAGATSDVPAQPDAAQAHSPETQPPA